MEMFDSLSNKLFVDSSKTGKSKYHPQNINKNHLSLLFAWTGMFLFYLVPRLGNDNFSTKLKKFKDLCDSAKDDLDSNSEVKKLALELDRDANSFLFLLTHPTSIHLDQGIIKELTFYSLQYFVISCFFIDSIKEDKWTNKKYLSHDDLYRIFIENLPTDHLKYYQSILSWWSLYRSPDYLNKYINEKNKPFSYLNSTELPLKGLYLTEGLNKQKNKIGIVSIGSVKKFEEPNECESGGLAVDIIIDKNIADNISLYAICFENFIGISNGFFFHKKKNINTCPTEELFSYLKSFSIKIFDLYDQIGGSLSEFIDSPDKFILPNLPNKKFRKYIEDIDADKDSLKSMKNFRDFNRAFLSADESFYWKEKEYTQVRKILVTALSKITQISSSMKALLIEANQALIALFYEIANGKALSRDDEAIIKYINKRKSESSVYKPLKPLGDDQSIKIIDGIDFFSPKKSIEIRNFCRKALPLIKNSIEGIPNAKPMSGKRLRQALGISDP